MVCTLVITTNTLFGYSRISVAFAIIEQGQYQVCAVLLFVLQMFNLRNCGPESESFVPYISYNCSSVTG